RECEQNGRSDESVERNSIDGLPIVEKVFRSVYVSSRVRSERDGRHVRAGTTRDGLPRLDKDFRIAGIYDPARCDGSRNVINPRRTSYDGRLDSLALKMKRGISAANVVPSGERKL